MVTEGDCAAKYPVCDVGQVDAGGAVHAQPRTEPAQIGQHLQPVPARKSAAPVNVERADAGDGVRQFRRRQRRLRHPVDVQRAADHRRVALVGERQPGQPGDRLTVAQQTEQDGRHRRSGGVVDGPVDRVQDPHQRRIKGRAAEFLAVHLDTRCSGERVDNLALDGQIDLGGEVVALLADRGVGTVTGDERDGSRVEDRRGLRDQRVQIGSVDHVAGRGPHPPTAVKACGSVNRPA